MADEPLRHVAAQHKLLPRSYTSPNHRKKLYLTNVYVCCAVQVRWSHWLMSHCATWQRDDMRLAELMPRVATLPLGKLKAIGCIRCISSFVRTV